MAKDALYRDFIYPPFSVLDARSGWWQSRKRLWLQTGIESHLGRKEQLLSGYADAMRRFSERKGSSDPGAWAGLSVFDPVLTELMYAWFCPPGGLVIDPFSGGSVRGLVAAALRRRYIGIDLSEAQVAANRAQAATFACEEKPVWIVGDATRLYDLCRRRCDFVFSCPPYGDLERYTDDPNDLSTMPYDMFVGALRTAVKAACARLMDHRFAAFVVGDFRDKAGIYRGFVGDTIAAFDHAGLKLYNEAILVTQGGSLPLRVRSSFEKSRKLGKTHQNVLIFVKGDPVRAREEVGGVVPYTFPSEA